VSGLLISTVRFILKLPVSLLTALGDGYDDFVCVAPNGDSHASINNKDGTNSRPPSFTDIGMIKGREGFDQDRVRWGEYILTLLINGSIANSEL
jgi:hypothetical protein